MSERSDKSGLGAALRQKPGKAAVLGLLAVGALWTWSGLVFGSDENAAPPATSAAPVPAPPAPPPGAPRPAAPPATSAIQSFQAAMERLEGWSEALRPEEIVLEVSVPERLETPAEAAPALAASDESLPALTATVLLGNQRFAVFGAQRVQEGDTIGRYEVAAIRSREVDLRDGDQIQTLRIRQAELGGRQSVQ